MSKPRVQLQGLAAVIDASGQLASLRDVLLEHVRDTALSHDGYPRRSIAGQTGVTNEVEPLLDGRGEPVIDPVTRRPVMVPVPQRSDPVAQTVIEREELPVRSEEAAVLRKVDRLIASALHDLDAAVRIARAATEGRPAPPENPDGDWCTSHLRVKPTPMHEPVYEKAPNRRLCRACYDWDLAYRRMVRDNVLPRGWPALPPPDLLAALGRGAHQTSKVLHDHLDQLVGPAGVEQYLAWCRGPRVEA